jgi:hypothetical protein
MNQRNCVLCVLCFLAGYLFHRVLKHGFHINLVEHFCVTKKDMQDEDLFDICGPENSPKNKGDKGDFNNPKKKLPHDYKPSWFNGTEEALKQLTCNSYDSNCDPTKRTKEGHKACMKKQGGTASCKWIGSDAGKDTHAGKATKCHVDHLDTGLPKAQDAQVKTAWKTFGRWVAPEKIDKHTFRAKLTLRCPAGFKPVAITSKKGGFIERPIKGNPILQCDTRTGKLTTENEGQHAVCGKSQGN